MSATKAPAPRKYATLSSTAAAEATAVLRAQRGEDATDAAAPVKKQQNIDVTVRVRPLDAGATDAFSAGKASLRKEGGACQSIVVMDVSQAGQEGLRQVSAAAGAAPQGPAVKHVLSFDRVLEDTASQEQVFAQVAAPMVESFMQGTNCALLAYGQTGSGKTHTMVGDLSSPGSHGILPRSLQRIFAYKHSMEAEAGQPWTVKLSLSCMEIYKDDAWDLMPRAQTAAAAVLIPSRGIAPTAAAEANKVRVRIIGDGTQIDNLTVQAVESAEEAMATVQRALSRRAMGSTAANAQSSRSHAVISIYLHATRDASSSSSSAPVLLQRRAIFDVVDLAGSERQAHTAAENDRLKEAAQINGSLLVLKQIIKGMKDAQVLRTARGDASTMLRWRDSTLTSVLRRSLLGNCSTSIIATINPDVVFWQESLATLDFAVCASKVKLEVASGDAIVADTDAAARRQAALEEQVRELKALLAAAHANGPAVSARPTTVGVQPLSEAPARIQTAAGVASPQLRALNKQLSAAAAAAQRWAGALRAPVVSLSSPSSGDSSTTAVVSSLVDELARARAAQWQLMLSLTRTSVSSMEDDLALIGDDFPVDTLPPAHHDTSGRMSSDGSDGDLPYAGQKRRRGAGADADARPSMLKAARLEDGVAPVRAQRSFRVARRQSAGCYDDDFADSLFEGAEVDGDGVEEAPPRPLQQAKDHSAAPSAALLEEHARALQQLQAAEARALLLEAQVARERGHAREHTSRAREALEAGAAAARTVVADLTKLDLSELVLRASGMIDALWAAFKAERGQHLAVIRSLQERDMELEQLQAQKGILEGMLEQLKADAVQAAAADMLARMHDEATTTLPLASSVIADLGTAFDAEARRDDDAIVTVDASAFADSGRFSSTAPVTVTDLMPVDDATMRDSTGGDAEQAHLQPSVAPRQRRLVPLSDIIKPNAVASEVLPHAAPPALRTSSIITPYWPAASASTPRDSNDGTASLQARTHVGAAMVTEPIVADTDDAEDVVSFHPRLAVRGTPAQEVQCVTIPLKDTAAPLASLPHEENAAPAAPPPTAGKPPRSRNFLKSLIQRA